MKCPCSVLRDSVTEISTFLIIIIISVEILSTAAQLYEQSHLKRLAVGGKSVKVIRIAAIW